MALNQRDQRVLVVLPAAVMLAVYVIFFFVPLQGEMRKNAERLERSKKTVGGSTAQASKEKLLSVVKTRDSLKSDLEKQFERNKAIGGIQGIEGQSFEVITNITRLLRENSLNLMAQEIVNPTLTGRQDKAFTNLNRGRKSAVEFRKFELRGRYGDMVQFLTGIQEESDSPALPISLKMDTKDSKDGMHAWELVIALL